MKTGPGYDGEMLRYPALPHAASRDEWEQIGRPRLQSDLQELVYGRLPPVSPLTEIESRPLTQRVTWRVFATPVGKSVRVLHFRPAGPPKATFVGISFHGLHTIVGLDSIPIDEGWAYANAPQTRGSEAVRWPGGDLLAQGYGLAVFCHADIVPDDPVIAPSFLKELSAGGEQGAIGAWGWGLASVAATLQSEGPTVLVGHSRMGKAALVGGGIAQAGSAVVAIQSGCGGAAPSRTEVGETLADITRVFTHWFSPRLAEFAGREDDLPLDQHGLLALCAPMPVFLPNAMDDAWANPEGQRLMAELAQPAYRLYGQTEGVEYAIRMGGHEVTSEDWRTILDFAERRVESRG